jgi:hypothetical protein
MIAILIALVLPSFAGIQDSALLLSIVSNTASTTVNTLKIFEKTKEYAAKIDEYHKIYLDDYYNARRVIRAAEYFQRLSNTKIGSHKQLNYELMRLKLATQSLEKSLEKMGVIISDTKTISDSYSDNRKDILDDQIEIDSMHKQNMLAEKMTMGQNILNVSKNTQKTNDLLNKQRKDFLDYSKTQVDALNLKQKQEAKKNLDFGMWMANTKYEEGT